MDGLKPTMELSLPNRDKELVNILETCDSYNNEGQVKNIREFELRILHHNVQSFNNKLLDIKMMLTIDNLNANILCFIEHWLLEDQMNMLYACNYRCSTYIHAYTGKCTRIQVY